MSKRRNRKQSPNLPPEMLERARKQLAQSDTAEEEVVEEVQASEPVQPEPKAEAAKPAAPAPRTTASKTTASNARARSNRRGNLQPAQSRSERKTDQTDTRYIRNRLANPTRFVSQEQLKQEYSYVISDLRSMGILAVVLLVAMVVIEKLLA
jgi:cobalamin biosynthesis Mg chelatase CobN